MTSITEFIKSQIKLYRSYAGDREKGIPGLFLNPGNIIMAERILRVYEQELKKREG
jgi:hypothetical protein